MAGTTIPSAYPTGYNAFYCMKYEMSQEQYVDFFNTLTRDQQNTRTNANVYGNAPVNGNVFVMSNYSTLQKRNGISCPSTGLGTIDPITFYCDYNSNGTGNQSDDGQNIACNYLDWMCVAAYADWAGLRPMSEGEFEKACRGPNNAVADEYAWGSSGCYSTDYTITNAGWSNEGISDMGTNTGNMLYGLTYGNFIGPGRCGIFAASSSNHTRVETGAIEKGAYFEQQYGYLNVSNRSFSLSYTVVDGYHRGNGGRLVHTAP